MTSARRAADRDELVGLLAPVVTGAGLDLEDVTISAAGRRRVLRVVVDRDGGVDLDTVAEVSRAISAVLDRDGGLGEIPYTLEVTSPGVGRPLTEPRHYRRALGRLVRVDTTDGRVLTGRIRSVHDDGIVLDVQGQEHELRWAALRTGHIEVEFSRPASDVDAGGGEG
jgi:ribosome maturation factor RimP